MPEQTSNVPPREVGRVVQDYVDDGVKEITCVVQNDGSWIVVARRRRSPGR